MLEQIDHVNFVVEDMEGMSAFYCDLLGLEITKEVTISGDWVERVVGLKGVEGWVRYLDLPNGPRVELIKYRSPKGARPADLDKPNTHGLRHLAFRVKDIDAIGARLAERGLEFHSEVQAVPDAQVTYKGGVRKRLVYFHDPEGNLLELCEYT
ncbi:MAG: VOC family protein [Planctomycetota bacterium]|jgi:catechol 2,3-dioxygenase-like lactoylglutathione lyase family enzyme|nr:VOC family protein [Planctomycetota bacterium]MDP7250836.1 VOC family protein [Planctomycetota bacterium]